jgi:hypothetical protein
MGLAILLIVVALVLGGLGLFVTALKWALILAVALLIAGVIAAFVQRGTTV